LEAVDMVDGRLAVRTFEGIPSGEDIWIGCILADAGGETVDEALEGAYWKSGWKLGACSIGAYSDLALSA
jgi:hypothetical protein